MWTQKEEKRLKEMDVLNLKRHGLTNEKISRVVDVSTKKIKRLVKRQKQLKDLSGVF